MGAFFCPKNKITPVFHTKYGGFCFLVKASFKRLSAFWWVKAFSFPSYKHQSHPFCFACHPAGERLRKELDGIEFSTQNIENLEKEIADLKLSLLKQAEKISDERKLSAEELSKQIIGKLEKLELPKVRFEIGFEPCELSPNGVDKVEFLISTNISEELKPLAKVASGGEISRVMLAIKTIFASSDNIDTIIFDEIDTGISGKTSQSVAEEVKNLSKYMQIIMITHQAIIASKSDMHIYVKKTQDDKTSVNISILENEDKLRAIAELASGEVTKNSLDFAKTLIK